MGRTIFIFWKAFNLSQWGALSLFFYYCSCFLGGRTCGAHYRYFFFLDRLHAVSEGRTIVNFGLFFMCLWRFLDPKTIKSILLASSQPDRWPQPDRGPLEAPDLPDPFVNIAADRLAFFVLHPGGVLVNFFCAIFCT